jgi:hypothetical protein
MIIFRGQYEYSSSHRSGASVAHRHTYEYRWYYKITFSGVLKTCKSIKIFDAGLFSIGAPGRVVG